MRTLVLTFGILFGALTIPVTNGNGSPTSAPTIGAMAVLDAQATAQPPAQQQPQQPLINVEVNHGGRAWYANPVWVAIGGIALVLVILLIVMAARGGGGGTTVVRG